ncbi:phosphopantetheine-binding protein, partial [Streptomyces sp. T-3]|nr:phosphopantetheine-binding protein [Streptomyces sp. T-3]
GLVELAPDHGLALLEAALPAPYAVLAPARLDREVLRDLGTDLPPILREVVSATGAGRPGNVPEHRRHRPLRDELTGLTAAERARTLADLIRTHMAAVLGTRPEAIADDRPFGELGFDSLTSVEFRNRLNAATDLRLPLTLLFEAPTLPELVAVLETELVPAEKDLAVLEVAAEDIEGMAAGTATDVTALVEAATAEELLDFIDRELSGS